MSTYITNIYYKNRVQKNLSYSLHSVIVYLSIQSESLIFSVSTCQEGPRIKNFSINILIDTGISSMLCPNRLTGRNLHWHFTGNSQKKIYIKKQGFGQYAAEFFLRILVYTLPKEVVWDILKRHCRSLI